MDAHPSRLQGATAACAASSRRLPARVVQHDVTPRRKVCLARMLEGIADLPAEFERMATPRLSPAGVRDPEMLAVSPRLPGCSAPGAGRGEREAGEGRTMVKGEPARARSRPDRSTEHVSGASRWERADAPETRGDEPST